jgi:hypothetical protein
MAPLVQIFEPRLRGDQWAVAARVQVDGGAIEIVARAPEKWVARNLARITSLVGYVRGELPSSGVGALPSLRLDPTALVTTAAQALDSPGVHAVAHGALSVLNSDPGQELSPPGVELAANALQAAIASDSGAADIGAAKAASDDGDEGGALAIKHLVTLGAVASRFVPSSGDAGAVHKARKLAHGALGGRSAVSAAAEGDEGAWQRILSLLEDGAADGAAAAELEAAGYVAAALAELVPELAQVIAELVLEQGGAEEPSEEDSSDEVFSGLLEAYELGQEAAEDGYGYGGVGAELTDARLLKIARALARWRWWQRPEAPGPKAHIAPGAFKDPAVQAAIAAARAKNAKK